MTHNGVRMRLSCNVDCGEVLPGHRLLARGLRDDGYSDDSPNGDYTGHFEGEPVHRMGSLSYAFVPGLSQPECGGSGLDVDADVALDPPPDPAVWGSALIMGAERDGRPAGSETAGAFGPFVFPEGTERVRVRLRQVTLVPVDAPRVTETAAERWLGTLDLDVRAGAAHWTPA